MYTAIAISGWPIEACRENDAHLAHGILKKNLLFKFRWRFFPKDQIGDKAALVRVMFGDRMAASHWHTEPMMT